MNRAKEISAFAILDGLFQYTVMPFGMKNTSATFQRMINKVIAGLQGCEGYIDDVVVYAETWEEHLHRMKQLFLTLRESQLTVNLAKTELGCAHVVYLGHVVGQGHVKSVDIKVSAVVKFPIPTSRQELMCFLGMAGYYRNRSFVRISHLWQNPLHTFFIRIRSLCGIWSVQKLSRRLKDCLCLHLS